MKTSHKIRLALASGTLITASYADMPFILPADTGVFTESPVWVNDQPFAVRISSVGSSGGTASDDRGTDGTSSANIPGFVMNTPLLVENSNTFNQTTRVLWAETRGGDGGNSRDDDKPAGRGGFAGSISLTVDDYIHTRNTFNQGLALVEAGSWGGRSGGVFDEDGFIFGGNDPDKDGKSFPGGNAGAVTVTINDNLVTFDKGASVDGKGDFYGVRAVSVGGSTQQGYEGSNGGATGLVTVNQNHSMDLGWISTADPASLEQPGRVYGIFAKTLGGDGGDSFRKSSGSTAFPGGNGGNAAEIRVNVSNGADITLRSNHGTGTQLTDGAAIGAFSEGGRAGMGWEGTFDALGYSGTSGTARRIEVRVDGANIKTDGDYLKGIIAQTKGGLGAEGSDQGQSSAGAGGQAETALISLSTEASGTAFEVLTTRKSSTALLAESLGGHGGDARFINSLSGGLAGDGGRGGNAFVSSIEINRLAAENTVSRNSIAVTTLGDDSPALVVNSIAGDGGEGGANHATTGQIGSGSANSGSGGRGGNSEGGTVYLGQNTQVTTSGERSNGISVFSKGGDSGTTGRFTADFFTSNPPDGVPGGHGGDIQITTRESSHIVTSGDFSAGIHALTLGGIGGQGGLSSSPFGGTSGKGADGGDSGQIDILHGGSITTSGDFSVGVIAQTTSGAGGASGDEDGVVFGNVADAGQSGQVGKNSFHNEGSILTNGFFSHGVVLQSMAGIAGDAGNASGGFFASGGGGGRAANGGEISLIQNGSVQTTGNLAHSLLLQSIGGEGGDGGKVSEVFASTGGEGADGGDGGLVSVVLRNGSTSALGTQSHAILAQSIGGGGGNGGNATSSGLELAFAIGGAAGPGGHGGSVNVTSSGNIFTGGGFKFVDVLDDPNSSRNKIFTGSRSVGILAQSVGGGGGNGGAALAMAAGADLAAAAAVGGRGGDGGDGGEVNLNLNGGTIWTGRLDTSNFERTNVSPTDAIGVLAQSIGGGGGHGGAAVAEAIAISVPFPGEESTQQFAASFAVGAGGEGAPGGHGGTVNANVAGGTQVITQGQGSHGLLGQSIGGGGGNGGDSSTLTATIGYSLFPLKFAGSGEGPELPEIPVAGEEEAEPGKVNLSLKASVSVGGDGGVGGHGGDVTMMVGDDDGSASGVTVYGDTANAVIAQSIGGGGGNAGFGNSNTASYGTKQSVDVEIQMGSTGGEGGNGGRALVGLKEGSRIVTYGAGSHGLLAQSIGGGGGTSQGGTFALGIGGVREVEGGPIRELEMEGKLEISMGATGGAGGNGGDASAVVDGDIFTYGGDSTAVIVQSIGGGGGLAGNAGAEASGDNPISLTGELAANDGEPTEGEGGEEEEGESEGIEALQEPALQNFLKGRSIAQKLALREVPLELEAKLELGSNDVGASGSGGNASATVGGNIRTSGDWSSGVLVQSIGGGGGKGGSAAATGLDISADIEFKLAGLVVLDGGVEKTDEHGVVYNADGGSASVVFDGATILTGADDNGRGVGAIGVHLQSIGGGGGIAIDGSDKTTGSIFLGDSDTVGANTTRGNGGSVQISGNLSQLVTRGQGAHGILLQSIGGGGGFGGAGSGAETASESDIRLVLGGELTATGRGGNVSILPESIIYSATLGDNAYGVIAQSIGGGGGIGAVLDPTSAQFNGISTSDAASISGGEIELNFAEHSYIFTSGDRAYGILAQSIGGGGGIAGYSSGSGFGIMDPRLNSTSGNGGKITINLDPGSVVETHGVGSHAIFAQSIGGGGGILATDTGTLIGSNGVNGSGISGILRINISGSVSANGADAYGILAQVADSRQNGDGNAEIVVKPGGSVTAADTAIHFNGGSNNALEIDTDAVVRGETAVAYTNVGSGHELRMVLRGGSTLEGNVISTSAETTPGFQTAQLASVVVSEPNWIQIENAGRIIAGEIMQADISNQGLFYVGPTRGDIIHNTTRVEGNFNQSSAGTIVVDADFLQNKSDTLIIDGDAHIDGKLRPILGGIALHQELEVMQVNGSLTGNLVADAATEDGVNLFNFSLRNEANSVLLRVDGYDFSPQGLALANNERAIAHYFNELFSHADTGEDLASLMLNLTQLAANNSGTYRDALGQLNPGAGLGFAARSVHAQQSFGNAVLNGPVFGETTAMPIETEGGWVRAYGSRAGIDTGQGPNDDYTMYTYIVQTGGQIELSEGIHLGGSLAYQNDRLRGDSGLVSGESDSAFAGATLKYEKNNWLFAGALTGSTGWIDAERGLTIPGHASEFESSQRLHTLGAVARIAYTFHNEKAYFRPMITGNLIHVHASGYHEKNNDSGLNLAVDSERATTLMLTPGFEAGLRTDLQDGRILRTYLGASMSFLSDNKFNRNARFASAPESAGGFSTSLPIDDVSANVTAGFQLQINERMNCFIQYQGEYSDTVRNHGGGLGFKVAF